jgi:hypothetical protein
VQLAESLVVLLLLLLLLLLLSRCADINNLVPNLMQVSKVRSWQHKE